jgi:hypothetical protein
MGSRDLVGNLKKFGPFLDLCVSSLRRGHANLLCIVPILSDVLKTSLDALHQSGQLYKYNSYIQKDNDALP